MVRISRDRNSLSRGGFTVAGSIVVVGTLIGCAWLHSVCDLRTYALRVQTVLLSNQPKTFLLHR